MQTPIDPRLRREAERFHLRFACPDCVYYDDVGGRCSEGYPVKEHASRDLERDSVTFCKLFEVA
ncbi:MAG TPA: hypothetical protein VLC09_16125 [Polyangiaceae bacterium]|nr:hypothetical protein [Polyangiaceae bacterium]